MKKTFLILAYISFISLFGFATWKHDNIMILVLPLFVFATWGFGYLWKKAS